MTSEVGIVRRSRFVSSALGVTCRLRGHVGMVCVCIAALAGAAGCGSSPSRSGSADASFERHFRQGLAHVRTTHDRQRLYRELNRTLASIRRDTPSTAAARRSRRLAIQGFEATRKGVRSLLDFSENDSGNLAAATIDARRADRYLTLGADRLRAAGRTLGISVGVLNQH